MVESFKMWMSEHEKKMFNFLRELIKIPSTSCHEEAVIHRIKEEMIALNFDEIHIDQMGNILGCVGFGDQIIAFDGHIDTVDVGNLENWKIDPFIGHEDESYIYGRGASDQTGGFVSALYAAAMLKDLNCLDDLTLWVVGSVQEEDCDGLCWQHILTSGRIHPDFVVLTEPTSLGVYRGHRGRMEIKVQVSGLSSHGSAPERGDNAIYKMAKIIKDLESLNENLAFDDFLGKGTLTVSEIFFKSPSRCAVADECSISVDRRLTQGETAQIALDQIKALKSVQDSQAIVSMYRYDKASYKGFIQDVACMFPTWQLPESHDLVQGFQAAHLAILGESPITDKWTFSTNGVSIMGQFGIPCIGYGPGDEVEAHAANEKIKKSDLTNASLVYAAFTNKLKASN